MKISITKNFSLQIGSKNSISVSTFESVALGVNTVFFFPQMILTTSPAASLCNWRAQEGRVPPGEPSAQQRAAHPISRLKDDTARPSTELIANS